MRWAGHVASTGKSEMRKEFGEETRGKEITWKTQALMGG